MTEHDERAASGGGRGGGAGRGRASCCHGSGSAKRAFGPRAARPISSPTPMSRPRRAIRRGARGPPSRRTRSWARRAARAGARVPATGRRAALGRRPARRHDQLPVRDSGVRGQRGVRGRRRHASPAWSSIRSETSASPPRAGESRRSNGERIEAPGRSELATALVATGFSLRRRRPRAPGRGGDAGASARARHPPRGRGSARSGLVRLRPVRRLLRARACTGGTSRRRARRFPRRSRGA